MDNKEIIRQHYIEMAKKSHSTIKNRLDKEGKTMKQHMTEVVNARWEKYRRKQGEKLRKQIRLELAQLENRNISESQQTPAHLGQSETPQVPALTEPSQLPDSLPQDSSLV